jgi:glycerol-3-phosphate dehydrogenase
MSHHSSLSVDVIVIGGGIVGTGIARDAALRGLRVALVEKEDFGAGTTSRSTRLIHGGLRYLEQLDFGLVRQDLRERELLLRNAPHLVRPLPFLVPFYGRGAFDRLKLRAGLALYDLLSYDRSLPGHRMLSRTETLSAEPGLNPEGLQGATLYHDAQISAPERLCVENALDAAAHGALVFNHTEVVGAIREEPYIRTGKHGETGKGIVDRSASPRLRLSGVRVRDRLTGAEADIRGKITVNAAGPWFDAVAGLLTGEASRRLRRTKGIHVAAPPSTRHAVVLFSEQDERLYFLIPWLGYTWVGTTDTDFTGDPSETRATAEEVAYLLRGARRAVPDGDWDSLYFTQAGVRALAREEGKHPSAVSRKHLLLEGGAGAGAEGLLSVVGGKLTAFRGIAEEVADRICRRLGRDLRGTTANRPLPGGRFESVERLQAECAARGAKCGLSAAQACHLVTIYGARALEVLDLAREASELASPLHPAYPDIRAQVHDAVQHEWCRTAADFLMRRSLLSFTPDQGRRALEPVIAEMAALCGWDAARCAEEREAYHRALELSAVPAPFHSGAPQD